uniref:JmjC domain-containing protein n=1 Tax=Amphimedon queenslandica TaxID=400682 RepID=A0A1X7VSF6_AMPQE
MGVARSSSSSFLTSSSSFTAGQSFLNNWPSSQFINGGWVIPHNLTDLTGPCNIKRLNRNQDTLSQEEFVKKFAYNEPVILINVTDQTEFRMHSTREQLLSKYGNYSITVTTANTHSYPKAEMTLNDYVNIIMKPQEEGRLGSDTLYHFGDNDREEWAELFSMYNIPPYTVPGLEPVISFGLAGPGTGVPFHIHGPTFAETIYGRKRWFLYSPKVRPLFDPNGSTLDWLTNTYFSLPINERPLECVLQPGEVLYFPAYWWHATLNVDASVFVSTFLA